MKNNPPFELEKFLDNYYSSDFSKLVPVVYVEYNPGLINIELKSNIKRRKNKYRTLQNQWEMPTQYVLL